MATDLTLSFISIDLLVNISTSRSLTRQTKTVLGGGLNSVGLFYFIVYTHLTQTKYILRLIVKENFHNTILTLMELTSRGPILCITARCFNKKNAKLCQKGS